MTTGGNGGLNKPTGPSVDIGEPGDAGDARGPPGADGVKKADIWESIEGTRNLDLVERSVR
jgi:hypothetical protein